MRLRCQTLPDGTGVGRIPPSCEFAPCPTSNSTSTTPPTTTAPPTPADPLTFSDPCAEVIAQTATPADGAIIAANCYSALAQSSANDAYCDLIPAERNENKISCHETVAAVQAIDAATAQGNATACDDIAFASNPYQVSFYKTQCLTQVAVKTKNPSVCAQLSEDAQDADRCYNAVAIAKNDVSVCDSITGFMKTGCQSSVNFNTQYGNCSTLSFGKDSCWYRQATQQNDPVLCANMTETQAVQITTSFYHEDFNPQTPTIAAGGVHPHTYTGTRKGACHIYMAGYFHDKSYCSSISNAELKAACQAPDQYGIEVSG